MSRKQVSESVAAMCRRFAVQHIGYYRSSKARGLRSSAAMQRVAALYWLAAMKGRA